ncbi:MAG TPA: hypothetical protein PK559_07300 [Ignavibacteriaceae bacterium]|nr:hypothetical protein [Ignavibacteriaceae bacterium]
MVKRIFIFLFFITIATFGQNITVSTSVDSTRFSIGDYINLQYKINHNKNIQIYFPNVKDSVKGLDYIESKPISVKDEGIRKISTYSFIFSKYEAGSATVPSISIPYKTTNDTSLSYIITDSLNLEVFTVEIDSTADIIDIKDPLTIPIDWLLVLLVITIIAIFIFISYWIYKKYQIKKLGRDAILPIVIKLPHEEAYESLQILDSKKLWQNGFIKDYHSEITAIIRRYFERRFNILALEMPTSEILASLGKSKVVQNVKETTEKFLENADMVKFAKFTPMNEVNSEMMQQAFQIIEQSEKLNPLVSEDEESNV